MAMVLRYLTMFSSTSPFSSLTCGGIHSEKKKRQKSQFLFTAQLLRKKSHLRRNPFRKKEKAEKSIFIYGTTFKKNESGRDFQQGQIWNDRSQKQKKNYGSHPVREEEREYYLGGDLWYLPTLPLPYLYLATWGGTHVLPQLTTP